MDTDLSPATGVFSDGSQRSQSELGSDGLTDEQRAALAETYDERYGQTPASRKAAEDWLALKRGA